MGINRLIVAATLFFSAVAFATEPKQAPVRPARQDFWVFGLGGTRASIGSQDLIEASVGGTASLGYGYRWPNFRVFGFAGMYLGPYNQRWQNRAFDFSGTAFGVSLDTNFWQEAELPIENFGWYLSGTAEINLLSGSSIDNHTLSFPGISDIQLSSVQVNVKLGPSLALPKAKTHRSSLALALTGSIWSRTTVLENDNIRPERPNLSSWGVEFLYRIFL